MLGIAGLVLVVNGLRPVRRLAPLVVTSFAAGWLTSETALHLLAIHLSVAVVIIAVLMDLGLFGTGASSGKTHYQKLGVRKR